MEMADIFGYDIDFALDLRDGDRFSVVYDQLYKDGKKLKDGDIVAAEFINRGHSYRAMRYVDADGNATYYTPDGNRSEEHTSELQSLMRISYAVFCLKKKKHKNTK